MKKIERLEPRTFTPSDEGDVVYSFLLLFDKVNQLVDELNKLKEERRE